MKYQILNIKYQQHKLNIKNFKIFNFLYACTVNFIRNSIGVFFIFNFLYLIFAAQSASAQDPNYPIAELGYCQNERECKLYCDISANTPSCWSYGKYVLNGNVLGEETVNITYPIADLGNCANAQDCFLFCARPDNQLACTQYAKKQGLLKEEMEAENEPPPDIIESAKTELGCSGKEACMATCNKPENMEKCMQFGQKHGLNKSPKGPPSPNIMRTAKNELGCDSEVTCMNVCNQPENMEKCFQFAKKHNLIEEEEVKKYEMHQEEYMEKKQEMMEKAKEDLGCDGFEACGFFCSKPENMEKCANLGRKFGMGPMQPPVSPPNEHYQPVQGQPQQFQQPGQFPGQPPILPPGQTTKDNQSIRGPGGCASEKECAQYCEKHPSDCPGFPGPASSGNQPNFLPAPISGSPSNMDQQVLLSPPPNMPKPPNSSKEGDFLGPAGCKTEKECKSYCEKHPKECPGFPPTQKTDAKITPGPNNPFTNLPPPPPTDNNKSMKPTDFKAKEGVKKNTENKKGEDDKLMKDGKYQGMPPNTSPPPIAP